MNTSNSDYCPTRYVRVRLSNKQYAFVREPIFGKIGIAPCIIGTRVKVNGDPMDEVVVASPDSIVGEYRMSKKYATLERVD